MKFPHRIAAGSLLPLLPLFAAATACSVTPAESVGAASEAVVSATTTYLLPVDDGVREACRATWTKQYCHGSDAVAAADACTKAYEASGAHPACATTSKGCFELETLNTACTADRPIYPATSACQAPVEHTCAFYSACLDQAHPCGESGYGIGYGEKYCSRYDVDHTFSPAGLVWRDAVLHCLQESLVSILPKASSMTCTDITTFAFNSHPKCYTEGPSICFLPPTDALNVISVIDGKDLLSLQSAQQMVSVAETCVLQIGWALTGWDPHHPMAPALSRSLPAALPGSDILNERLTFWQNIANGNVPAAKSE